MLLLEETLKRTESGPTYSTSLDTCTADRGAKTAKIEESYYRVGEVSDFDKGYWGLGAAAGALKGSAAYNGLWTPNKRSRITYKEHCNWNWI